MGGTMQALLNKNSSPTTSGTQAASLQIMDTLLSPSEEASFQQWKAKYAPNDSGQDYDLRGAYKAGIDPIRMGWPEAFKKPNHPSYRAPMDKFETPLTPQEEIKFQAWKKQYAPNDSGFDYDFRGAFINGASPGADGHWDDQWKKPNHPTFSVLSRYAEQVPEKAGHWWPDRFLGPDYIPGGLAPAHTPIPVTSVSPISAHTPTMWQSDKLVDWNGKAIKNGAIPPVPKMKAK